MRVEDLLARQAHQACLETQATLEAKAWLVKQGFQVTQVTQVTQGLQGLQGPQAPQGPQGLQGFQGSQVPTPFHPM